MNVPKKQNNGCLWIVLPVILTLFSFGFFKFVFALSSWLTLGIAIVFSLFLSFKILGKPTTNAIFKTLASLAVFFFIVVLGLSFLNSLFYDDGDIALPTAEEGVVIDSRIEQNDTLVVYKSHRIWRDNFGKTYTGDLVVRDRDYQRLKGLQNKFAPKRELSYWGQLYLEMDKTNAPSLDLVMETFEQINREKQLNEMEFADMVVSCIQDIPYSFVFEAACLSPENYELSIRRVLEKCPDCCIGGITYGVQNQVSFLQNLKGDCDTRTVLIYSILNYFGYDVAILNSNEYLHSIIGLNIPGTGSYKLYNGKKYVVWETTALGHPFGKLPYAMTDLNHWNVVLTSK